MREKIRVVTIGGGTGQSTLLRALVRLPFIEPTAIVTTFDSGGSSRELKDRHGVLPYGDIQRCIFALSPYEHVREIFSTRITMPRGQPAHTGGNLLLSALEQEFGRKRPRAQARMMAIEALSTMFSIRGRVIPAALEDAELYARTGEADLAISECEVDEQVRSGREIRSLFLNPSVPANPAALDAIADSDFIIVGPGSLYTSVLAPMLPTGMADAVVRHGRVMWVMNISTEGELMAHWQGERWLHELQRIVDPGRDIQRVPRWVLVNDAVHALPAKYAKENKHVVVPERFPARFMSMTLSGIHVIKAPLWRDRRLARHSEDALAGVLGQLIPRFAQDPTY